MVKSSFITKNETNEEKPILRYVLYARKSSEDVGAQAKSLPDQINDCIEYAENKGIIVVETLMESQSAKTSGKRPVFAKMLKDLESGKYDGILTWHPDRLARNSLEAGMIVDMVDNGIIKDLKFPTLEFTNDSGGKLLLNIMFAMSKQYSEHLSESVQRGVDSNLAQGKSGGIPKWGYNRSEITGYYEPDNNFEFIKHGFEMYLEGHTQREIIDYWRQNDVHRMTKLTRKNRTVKRINVYDSDSTIGSILSDPFYYGVLVQAKQQVDLREIIPSFKPMLTEEQFGEVQARRRKLKKVVSASVKAIDDKTFIPFRQLMRCGVCGNFMHVARSASRTGEKYLYFRCGNPECTRDKKNIRVRVFLNELYEKLEKLHFGKKEIDQLRGSLNNYIDNRHRELTEEKLRVNAMLKAKARKRKDLSQKYIDLGKDAPSEVKELLKEQIDECKTIEVTLQAELNDIEEKIFDPNQVQGILEELTNQLDSLADKMRSADAWQKDQLVRKLVTNLEISNKNEVSFRWKKPLEDIFDKALKNKTRFGAPD